MKKVRIRPKWTILSLDEASAYIRRPGTYIDELIDHPKGRGAKSRMWSVRGNETVCLGTVRGDVFLALVEAQMVKRTKAPPTVSATYKRYVWRPKEERTTSTRVKPGLID